MINMSTPDKFFDGRTAAVNAAEQENDKMLSGDDVREPQAAEELLIHWEAHVQQLNNASTKNTLPEDPTEANILIESALSGESDDEVEVKEEKKDKEKDGDKKEGKDEEDEKDDKPKEKEGLKIDMEGFESRVIVLPMEAGNYNNMNAIKGQILFTKYPRSGTANGKSSIVTYILEDREEKTIIEDE